MMDGEGDGDYQAPLITISTFKEDSMGEESLRRGI